MVKIIGNSSNLFTQYVNSSQFGKDAYITIRMYRENFNNMLKLIEKYLTDLKKDSFYESDSISDKQVMILKQFAYVDIISKLVSVIEGDIILIGSLSLGYHDLSKDMTYYNYDKMDSIIHTIRTKKINMRRVLGYCELKKLNLGKEERQIMSSIYEQNYDEAYKILEELIQFYTNFRIAYGKFKHGLNFIAGLHKKYKSDKFSLCGSVLVTLDNKPEHKLKDLPYLTDSYGDHYNVMSRICFNENLFQNIDNIITKLRLLINYICINHLLKAENLGELYLPLDPLEPSEPLYLIDIGLETENNENYKSSLSNIMSKMKKNIRISELVQLQNNNVTGDSYILNFKLTNKNNPVY